jgi:hypothetical protein
LRGGVMSEVTVYYATEDDCRVAVANALRRAGCTFTELAEMARTNDFTSVRAQLAWHAIGDLGHLAGD